MPLTRRKLVASNRLAAGDASKALIASPGTGYRLRIFRVFANCLTVAAQTIQVGESGGAVTTQVLVIAASASGTQWVALEEGFPLTAATAFSAVPAAAGPAWQFVVEYTIEPV